MVSLLRKPFGTHGKVHEITPINAGWSRITCFNGLGKTVAEHCEKGMKVLVQARIHYTKWTDATGTDRYGCEIIAEKVDFLSRPTSAEAENPELVDREGETPF